MSNKTSSTTTMTRSLSPSLRRELENLDKDADSRKSAMKAIKSYVKDLDSKAIPLFLARVSQTKDSGSSYGEFTISLYEVLARVHGPKIIPQIDNIMNTIIKTLNSGTGSFALHQACSKVVPAIARYGIDPTMDENSKKNIILSLCKPLSDSLLVSHEGLASGSALCLKALVDSDNWRFASTETVNQVCMRVCAGLEKLVQPNAHMGLVMALAKNNGLIVEAYARLLIQSGIRILNVGVKEGNSQKRLSAIQMVNYLMKCLDPKSLFSELGLVIEQMEMCESDPMAYVSGAAYEALQTAKKIIMEKGEKIEKEMSGSNFGTSPESQTVGSFGGNESPVSGSLFNGEYSFDKRSVNRKLWRRSENGGVVDISLKDGLFSEAARGNYSDEMVNSEGDFPSGFAGFFRESPMRSNTPSPQRSHINIDNFKIFTTPRKLIHSLQSDDPNSENNKSGDGATKCKLFRSPSCSKCGCTPTSKYEENKFSRNSSFINEFNKNNDRFFGGSSESVSSTEDIIVTNGDGLQADIQIARENKNQIPTNLSCSKLKPRVGSMVFGFVVTLIAVFVCFLRITSDQGEGGNLVPT